MRQVTRRRLLAQSGLVVVAAAATAPAASAGAVPAGAPARTPLRVLVTGGHPDDPESGCGGTIARYADEGHRVTVLYLTRGEGGIPGKSAEQAAAVRSTEAERACRILKATPAFAGQIDGATEVNAARYAEFRKIVEETRPDVIFTQWPVDTHPDHRACSLLTYDAWLRLGRRAALYYYEVDLGAQTQCFRPTDYVDVSATAERRRDACLAHESQNPVGGFWTQYHEPMLRLRGLECGKQLAEAFVRHEQGPPGRLPGEPGR
jgi:LmbE family N-acetylglucosaminyl deacetylase